MDRNVKLYQSLVVFLLLLFSRTSFAELEGYGRKICKQEAYTCKKITRHDSWSSLFPDADEIDLVKRINRTNGFLKLGMVIAVPKKLDNQSFFDYSPFPTELKGRQEKVLIVDQAKMAWGAYNDLGQLLRWGPISAGSAKCFASPAGCETPVGTFHVTYKRGKNCYSHSFPEKINGQRGGGYMPYCMFFYKGYALHGSYSLPGYNASHGCVRLFMSDAKWLYEYFVKAAKKDHKGTKIVILPISQPFSQTIKGTSEAILKSELVPLRITS